jgi:hypothetical protein
MCVVDRSSARQIPPRGQNKVLRVPEPRAGWLDRAGDTVKELSLEQLPGLSARTLTAPNLAEG